MEEIDDELIRELLREQRPDLAEPPISHVARGWDNELWRLGGDLAVRVPRTERASDLLRKEYRWLTEIAPRLPLPVPTPQYLGEPSPLFPQPWTIVAWVSGEPADRAEIEDESSAAVLAKFLRALHTEVPASAPRDGGKGERVRNAQLEFDADLIEVLGEDRVRRIEEIWRDGRSAGAPRPAPG